MIWLILFFGVMILIGLSFGKKALQFILIFLGIICILLFIAIVNEANNGTSNVSSSVTPTPTINPYPTWHTVYTISGGNGQANTDDFKIKGNKWRIDYQTFNDSGTLDITDYANIQDINVSGIAKNSIFETNTFEVPEPQSLNINSTDQNYSIKVEDYY